VSRSSKDAVGMSKNHAHLAAKAAEGHGRGDQEGPLLIPSSMSLRQNCLSVAKAAE
jgi:hypothetical protein